VMGYLDTEVLIVPFSVPVCESTAIYAFTLHITVTIAVRNTDLEQT
jgi:hypothetical protein